MLQYVEILFEDLFMTRKELFLDKIFNKELLKLTVPIALQNLMLALVGAADALMLGMGDQDDMSAVSQATQIQFIQNMFFFAIITAVTILAAQYWGKGNKKAVEGVICIGLRLNIVISVVFFAGCMFFPKQLMFLFTDQRVLIDKGAEYLRIAGWSYLMTGISQIFLCVLKVTEKPRMSAIISSTTVVLNIFLNAVLIFGLFGIKPMGVRGAALATLIARTFEIVWCIAITFFPGYFRLTFKGLFSHSMVLVKDFYKCLLPLIAASLLWGVGFTTYTAFMGRLGKDAVAANSVSAVVRNLVCCLCDGLATGGGIVVGNVLGAGDLEKGKLYGRRLKVLAFICGFGSTVIMLLVTPGLLSFVKLTSKAREYLLWMMLVMSVYMIGRAVNTIVINGIFSAGGDTKFDMYSLCVTMWGLAVPLAALGTFVFHWHPIAVYALTCLDEVGKIPWTMYHFKKYKWVKDLTKENL